MVIKLYGLVGLMLLACAILFGSSGGTVTAGNTTVPVSSTPKSTTSGKKPSVDIEKIVSSCNKEANDILGNRNANKTALACCVSRFTSDCVEKKCKEITGCTEAQKKAIDVKGSCENKQITMTLAQCKALSVKVNLPLIIGCVVGGIAIIILIIAIVIVCRKKFCTGKPAKGEEVKFKLGKHMNLSEVDEVEVIDNASTAGPSAVGGVSGVSSVGSKAPSVAGGKSKHRHNSEHKGGKGKDKAADGGSKDKAKNKASSAKGKATSIQGASKEKVGGKGKAMGNVSEIRGYLK